MAGAAFLLGAGGNVRVQAQTGDGTGLTDPAAAFGGFSLQGSASGFQLIYDSPGLLPISPIFELSMPDAVANLSNGPASSALASVAYPGPVVSDLGTVIAQSGNDVPIPPYPVRSQAFYPTGPTDDEAALAPGADMRTVAGELSAEAHAVYSSADLPGFFTYGSIEALGNTSIVDGQAVSRSRTVLHDVDLFYGVVKIDSVATDLVSTSDGSQAASDGTTTVSGVTFLGLAATLGPDGLALVAPQPDGEPSGGPLDPVTGPLLGEGSPLEGVVGPSEPALSALNGLITQVIGANGTVNDLLEAAGISIHTLEPIPTADGGTSTRTANGVIVELRYDGRTEPVFSQLLAAIPTEQLPSDNLVPGVPLQTSPQAAVNLLKETHIVTISLAPAFVSSAASPAYVPEDFPFPSTGAGGAGAIPASPPSGSFTTPVPALAGPGTAPASASVPLDPQFAFGIGTALPAALILVVALGAPLFAAGSRRLADHALAAAAGTACPLDGETGGRGR